MERKLVFFLGVVCSFGYYSCAKNMVKDPSQADLLAQTEFNKKPGNCGCVPADTGIFDPDFLIAPNERLKTLREGFSFTEGPAVDKHGNIFFTDQPNDKIWKYGTDGKLSVFMNKTGRSNGLYFDKEGYLIACADEKNQVWRISPAKKVTILIKDYKSQK